MSRFALQGAVLRRLPDRQAESNLVHEVREVVDRVQDVVIDGAHEVAEEVAQGVDGPADGDDEAHRREGLLHVLVHVTTRGHLAGLAREDLEEDEGPASHAEDEADEWRNELSLAHIAECHMATVPKSKRKNMP